MSLWGWVKEQYSDPYSYLGPVGEYLAKNVAVPIENQVISLAVASKVNAGTGPVGVGDVIGAVTDPIVPNQVYVPNAGLAWGGGIQGHDPEGDGAGVGQNWFNPAEWQPILDPLKDAGKGLLALAAVAAVAYLGTRDD